MPSGCIVISCKLGDDMRRANADKLRKQVSILAKFGERSLRSENIEELLQEATRLVSEAMDVDLVKVLQLLPDGKDLVVRAGVNWKPGVVGHAKIPAHEGSPAGHALRTDDAVITEDVANERRFEIPELLIEHGVRSTVNVVIRGERGPFGVLEVDAQRLCQFDQDDIDFLQNYANLLAAAVERVNTHRELEESARKLDVLAHELQHRMNNMLATIRAVARSARTKYTNVDEFVEAFDNRLAAISRVHNLLGRPETTGISLREILRQELAAFDAVEGKKLVERGPDTAVSPKQAEALEMAFHELATNAVKHGALSAKGGRISVSWDAHPHGPGKQVHIRWRESGAQIEHDPTKRGFGSEILDKAIPHMLNGTIERKFHHDGLECVIEFATET
jgi:two-component sensor histidine kinase/putative methionine-R-sulfoxide reductase with GAF domain